MALARTISGIISAVSYEPGMMTYDGSTGYYSKSVASSGNALTTVFRINSVGSTSFQRLIEYANQKLVSYIFRNDHGSLPGQLQFICYNTTGTNICNIMSENRFDDGADHIVFFAFDATAGTVILRIDGVDEEWGAYGGRVVTTGTLKTTTENLFIGRQVASAAQYMDGDIGFCGIREAYLTNYGDFMDGSAPKELDESGWTEWGAQPIFWNQFGTMTDNKGSLGNMTKNGTITGPT